MDETESGGGWLPALPGGGPTSIAVKLDLDADVIAAFKMMGPDWQRRMEAVLSDAAHYLRPGAPHEPILLSARAVQRPGLVMDSVEILHRGGGWVVCVTDDGERCETKFSFKAAASKFADDETRRLQLA